ncbi:helix-turn-helix domain-containing protein [Lacrimispora saccharolytica]|uniref:Transcriptional regulator, XRE family n=1 Tax=Lacrimispora saccharolytica (strain ATCC 35040 / DSM 2544 / NRCC 2533 / WM1) TaxID=610130 RepID=D9R6A2_LACSW|nr:helix-turn-helix transcriptional regulator [Lacrimispora saccharolytica]ADL05312.1 transcriptional regulator, XRE family [[Clostridium] saccharolyticum WM1]QRV20516.1 helix-turn-helix transcriptional regulator [Lacrimispora saccharolytica]
MLFGDRIKELRNLADMSQQELANRTGLSLRSIQNYESNQRYPKDVAILNKLCAALGTTIEELMKEEDQFILEAASKFGSRGKNDAEKLIEEVGGLFAGGELNEEDKDKVFRAITEMYWKAKDNNKKYTPKKYKKNSGANK